MDAQVPRTNLTLVAGSVADDLSYVALADAVQALEKLREPEHCRLIGGQSFSVLIPDDVSALILKTLAWDIRYKDTDAADIWRCLEIAYAAGVQPSAFESDDGRMVRALLQQEFAQDDGAVMKNIREYYQLPQDATTRRRTRIRALIGRVFGSG